MNLHSACATLLVFGLFSFGDVDAQSEPGMMDKRESGQPLSEPVAHNLCSPEGVAVGGYDLISYRQDNGPRLGSPQFSAQHNGLSYLFENKANQPVFNARLKHDAEHRIEQVGEKLRKMMPFVGKKVK